MVSEISLAVGIIICCGHSAFPQTVLTSMKQRIEEMLAKREIPTQRITSRITAWVNA